MRAAFVIGMALLAASCNWVKTTQEGDNVAVLTAEEVRNCTMLSDITVTVPDSLGVPRSDEAVAEDLRALARNTAASRGGDAIVPTTQARNGQRSYNVYRCRR